MHVVKFKGQSSLRLVSLYTCSVDTTVDCVLYSRVVHVKPPYLMQNHTQNVQAIP